MAGETLTKGDESPVTVADFAAQAVVIATLTERLGAVEMVGEEDAADLIADDRSDLRSGVTDLVRRQLGAAVGETAVVDWIAAGSSDGHCGPQRRSASDLPISRSQEDTRSVWIAAP